MHYQIPELPNIPLEMPSKDYLYKRPKHPYEYPLGGGIIRGRDFEKLLQELIGNYLDEEVLKERLNETLGYHVLADIFGNWDIQELSDFCRHIIQINRDRLGWDLVDIIDLELNKITIPGWRLPNFEFIDEFNTVLSQIHKIYFPDRLLAVIATILEKNKQDEIQFENEIKRQLHLWTIRDLWLLLNYVVDLLETTEDIEGSSQIFNLISAKFEEIIESGTLNVKSKICVILLYIDAITDVSKQTTMHSKHLIDRIWQDVANLDYSEKISFKYLLGAAYSIVGEQLFKQDTDFVTRKLFIDNFIQNYVLDEYDLGRWFADLLDFDVDELIFDLLIRGYSKTVPLLHKHAIELPPSATKERVVNRIQQFNGVLADILIYYLGLPEELSDQNIKQAVLQFHNRFNYERTRFNMLELLFRVSTSSVFYNLEFAHNTKERLAVLTSYLLKEEQDEFRSIIFDMDYRINSDSYNIQALYSKIMEEVSKHQSLILSETFEDEIIQKVASAIEYLNMLDTFDDLYLEISEITIQFMLFWLQEFSPKQSDFKEALLLFSPMINILFHGMIRYYYENNHPKKAFLSNLNLHSFMNYFTSKVQAFENINLGRQEVGHAIGINERFREITSKFNIRDILLQSQVKEMIIDARAQFKESGLVRSNLSGNLIEDALIHGYLDEINRLENFINRDFSKEHIQDLGLILLESGIYQEGLPESTYRIERIGSNLVKGEIIPVPLFKNVHRLAIATEFFEIKSSVETVEERNQHIRDKFLQQTERLN